ncbi:hypothetical protein A1C_05975 [Rickettsia akari str. Hartford]|uniref:Uncharacterized protein n=1 Tax=Rickettsia akari (strain Hartford) TaxID=293614 RepID=A8GPV3_RICAH|nr:hypothetical protein A1C_05975 [Rickettsia akari str. Hartford]
MTPVFALSEVSGTQKLWVRGGFPLSYLADDKELSTLWRQHYIKTLLERDIPNLGLTIGLG